MTIKSEELTKHTLHLIRGDYSRLQEAYPKIGAAAVIRKLVNTHLAKIDPAIDTGKIKGDLKL